MVDRYRCDTTTRSTIFEEVDDLVGREPDAGITVCSDEDAASAVARRIETGTYLLKIRRVAELVQKVREPVQIAAHRIAHGDHQNHHDNSGSTSGVRNTRIAAELT